MADTNTANPNNALPAADSSTSDHTNIKTERQSSDEPLVESFVPGHLLIYSPLKVRLNPSRGWNFEGSLPPYVQDEVAPTFPSFKTCVGVTQDGAPPEIVFPNRHPNLDTRYYSNQHVFLAFDASQPTKYRLFSIFGYPVPEQYVAFDPEWEPAQKRTLQAWRLAYQTRLWMKEWTMKRNEAAAAWERARRSWEVKFLVREWFTRGNQAIFPPGTTDGAVLDAVMAIEQAMPVLNPSS